MRVDDLIAEGERISRRCLLLSSRSSGPVAGYWGGERSDTTSGFPSGAIALRSVTHVVTIDAGLLAPLGISVNSSPLSIFRVEPMIGDTGYRVLQPAGARIEEIGCSGEPLHAQEASSFPPFEALCLYGGDPVSSWLKNLGLERFEYYAAGAEAVAREYETEFIRRSPVHTNAADVVLGGWHQIWPEDDFYLPLEMRLAMLTLRDAEPWLALWHATGLGNWSVREHVT